MRLPAFVTTEHFSQRAQWLRTRELLRGSDRVTMFACVQ